MEPSRVMTQEGFFSVLRYRSSPSRDETRNIAVMLVDALGNYAEVKAASVGSVSRRLRTQGIMDALLVGISRDLRDHPAVGLRRLEELSETLDGSLLATEPRPTAIPGQPRETLDALFAALVAPHTSRGPGIPKSRVLDRVVASFRETGTPIRRGAYVGDFLFDALVEASGHGPLAIHAESFALPNRDWASAERDAGHFLYAVQRLRPEAICVVQEPSDISTEAARRSHERILRWLGDSGVPHVAPGSISIVARSFAPEEQLPLVMA